MKKSEFLTETAKRYDSKIGNVFFCKPELMENSNGLALAYSGNGGRTYKILINKEFLFCANHALYVFFHEVGHVLLGHFGLSAVERYISSARLEVDADDWAFDQMGVFDHEGKVKKENALCFDCIKADSRKCYKKRLNGSG